MSYSRTTSARRPFNQRRNSQLSPHTVNPSINRQAASTRAGYPPRRLSRLPVQSRAIAANGMSHSASFTQQATQQTTQQTTQPTHQSRPIQPRKAALRSKCKRAFSNRVAWIGIGAIALSLLAVVPMRVDSESIDLSSCEQKIKPTGAISRSQMSSLLALPTGANKEAVRKVISEPYCTLPAIAGSSASGSANSSSKDSKKELAKRTKLEEEAIAGAYREAYPLAFDPEAWVVVAYSNTEEYIGYDFVFKPR